MSTDKVDPRDLARANAINCINAGATPIGKAIVGPADVGMSQAAGMLAVANAILYLAECIRHTEPEYTITRDPGRPYTGPSGP